MRLCAFVVVGVRSGPETKRSVHEMSTVRYCSMKTMTSVSFIVLVLSFFKSIYEAPLFWMSDSEVLSSEAFVKLFGELYII